MAKKSEQVVRNFLCDEDLALAFESLANEENLSATQVHIQLMRQYCAKRVKQLGYDPEKIPLQQKQIDRLKKSKRNNKKFVSLK